MNNSNGNNSDIVLQVEHLKQHYRVRGRVLHAVDDVSFAIRKGEVFGLVGESGCGKTTIARSIINLYDITAGNIYFKGQSVSSGKKEKNHCKVMTKMQMIFQDSISSLDPRMTVREIIAEGPVIKGVREKAYLEEKVLEVMNLVGLRPEYADRYPHEFSGGQRQRIAIARALIMEPELLIADEPISALDGSMQAQIIFLFDELRNRFGLTILFIAHDLSVVKYFADRTAVMYQGRIVEQAETKELFRTPVHPYTQSLLSAIPIPDPHIGKLRKRIRYQPCESKDSSIEERKMHEVTLGHFVLCNTKELEQYRRIVRSKYEEI